jgi:DNA-binding NarL/FixJ family response regulator
MSNEHASGVDFIRPVTALLNVNKVTGSERAILYGILQGMSNREISDQMCVQLGTVKFHVTNLFKKLNVRDRPNLIIKIAKLGHYGQRNEVIAEADGLPRGALN